MLYRLYGEAGELLYVGISDHLGRRLHQHSKTKSWWGDVRRIDCEPHQTRQAAEAAEADAVRRELPLHNIALTNTPRPRLLPSFHTTPDDQWRGMLAQVARHGAPCGPGRDGAVRVAPGPAMLGNDPIGWCARAYRDECDWDWAPLDLDHGDTVWGWRDNGRLIAFAYFGDPLIWDATRAVMHLWTAAAHRRQGVASRLVDAALNGGERIDGHAGPYTLAGAGWVRSRPAAERPWWVERYRVNAHRTHREAG